MQNIVLKAGNAKKEAGFTLVELIVAVFVLSVGLLAVGSMQIGSVKGNSTANGITQGITWAENQVERLIERAYDDPLLADTDGDGTNQDADSDGQDDNGGNFGLDDVTVATADNSLTQGDYTVLWNVAENVVVNNTKTVNIIVIWMDFGTQKRVTIQRVIPRII
ncbi:MAG: prepilin-type N-terminal cleavage/methylation domain-containing protein [Deltaproteobacteria bacterium]|nr:prepilin-type N-terminal cleavage/methylation domain-containing protein [Deltaproteobacteria bacterium]